MDNVLAMEYVGDGMEKVGGLMLLWKNSLEIDIKSFSINHIDTAMTEIESGKMWRASSVYGYPEITSTLETCDLIMSLSRDNELPWVCFRDFNMITAADEKRGGNDSNLTHMEAFHGILFMCNLVVVKFSSGNLYTWWNK